MEKLNHVLERARLMHKNLQPIMVDIGEIEAIAEAFLKLEQRAEAAEAKLAELDKQEPYCWHDGSDYLLEGCWEAYKTGHHTVPVYAQPAPAINLAELVPPEKNPAFIAYVHLDETTADKPEAYAKGFNACRAAILRNIEEQSK